MKTKMESMRRAIKKLPLASKVTCSGAVPGEEVAMFLSNHRAHNKDKCIPGIIPRNNTSSKAGTCGSYQPVSYTHLDVYKRQQTNLIQTT